MQQTLSRSLVLMVALVLSISLAVWLWQTVADAPWEERARQQGQRQMMCEDALARRQTIQQAIVRGPGTQPLKYFEDYMLPRLGSDLQRVNEDVSRFCD